MPGFHEWAGDKRLKALVFLVLILAVVALGSYSYFTLKQSKYIFGGPTTISVSGKGEVMAKPDLATFSFSVIAEDKDATKAQSMSAESMNKILAFIKEKGVEEKDIKTSDYSLTPKYRWEQAVCVNQWNCPPGKQIDDGFTVNQTVTVKVRKTEIAGDLLSGVGENGGTNVSGLSFTIDDEEKLKDQARELAIKDAKEQAEKLAKSLGVRIVRMSGYSEENGGYPMPMYDMKMSSVAGMAREAAIAPDIPTGENKITSNVVLYYEIK